MKYNMGCGNIRPNGWINVDSSLTNIIQQIPFGKWLTKIFGKDSSNHAKAKFMNLGKPWRNISSETADVIYASHLFEHLNLKERDRFLAESYRTLKRKGAIRLVVPDLEQHAREYILQLDEGNRDASEQFLWALNLHREGQYPSNELMHRILGYLQGYPHQHKFMYDQYSMAKLLQKFGFSKIQISSFGESNYIQDIFSIEFNQDYSYGNSLYIEAVKE
jgi:hypothetical protein